MTWQVLNPYDQKCIGSVDLVDWSKIDRWLDEARTLHEDRQAWIPVHERIAILQCASSLMHERAESLAMQIAREGGKPLVDARAETSRAVQSVELCVHELFASGGRQIPMELTEAGAGRTAYTFRRPAALPNWPKRSKLPWRSRPGCRASRLLAKRSDYTRQSIRTAAVLTSHRTEPLSIAGRGSGSGPNCGCSTCITIC